MCWTISKIKFDENPEEYHKIADKNIIVYKIGYLKTDLFGTTFCPYFRGFIYTANSTNKEIKMDFRFYCINKGYHSYSDECYIKEGYIKGSIIIIPSGRFLYHLGYYRNALYYRNTFIGKFIIPKGTEYYTNEDGEIVSSNIIWTGEYYKTKDIKEPFINFKKLDYVLVGDKKEDI